MTTMTLGTISICMTVVVLNMHHRGRRYRIPKWVRKSILSYLARIVCIETTCRVEEHRAAAATGPTDSNFRQPIWLRRQRPGGGAPTGLIRNGKGVSTSLQCQDQTETIDQDDAISEQPCLSRQENGATKPEVAPVSWLPKRGLPITSMTTNRRPHTTIKPFFERWNLDEGALMSEDDRTKEWQELARVLDRLFFWIIFTLMTVSAVVILMYPKYAGVEDSW